MKAKGEGKANVRVKVIVKLIVKVTVNVKVNVAVKAGGLVVAGASLWVECPGRAVGG